MLYRIDEDIRQFLLSQPEYGMGYQLVQRNDDGNRILILNAELGVETKHLVGSFEHDRMQVTAGRDFRSLQLNPQDLTVLTHGSYSSRTRKGEVFVRYSAFPNDRRIQSDGSVVSGSYVTTENDAGHWGQPFGWTGLSVVARYALPDPRPAINLFLLRPRVTIPILCGTVAPNYGQAGGGVEVRFESDTPPKTLIRTDRIPDR